MKNCFKIIRNHPIIMGIAGSICLIGLIVCYQLSASRNIIDSTVETQELQRTAEIDKLNYPDYLVKYLMSAIEKRDVDMALRGFAMDESIINIWLEKIITAQDRFYTDMEIAPSGSYKTYNEVSAAELAGKYSQSFQALLDFFDENERIIVKEIDYVKPEQQLSSEKISKNAKVIEARGGDCLCEMMALIEHNGQEYILGITLNHYGDYWKIFHLGAELTETTEEEPIRLIDAKEYDILKGKMRKSDFQKELQDMSIDFELFEEEMEPDNYEKLLPANYFIVNGLKEDSPQKVIEKFVLCIEREDLVRAIGYCVDANEEELEHTTTDILRRQADCAKEIKRFCYGFLGCDYEQEESSLEQIGKSGSSIQNELNPENFMYFDLLNVFLVEDNGDEKQYIVCYLYDGEYYMSGMTLVNHNGWKIQSLSVSCDKMKLDYLKKIKKKEYEKIERMYEKA